MRYDVKGYRQSKYMNLNDINILFIQDKDDHE